MKWALLTRVWRQNRPSNRDVRVERPAEVVDRSRAHQPGRGDHLGRGDLVQRAALVVRPIARRPPPIGGGHGHPPCGAISMKTLMASRAVVSVSINRRWFSNPRTGWVSSRAAQPGYSVAARARSRTAASK